MEDDLDEAGVQKVSDGIDALDSGDYDTAIQLLAEAQSAFPRAFTPPYHLGLAYKAQQRWPEALDVFLKAWARLPDNVPLDVYTGVLWNVGIVASVLGVWRYTRMAWERLGHPMIGAEGPPSIPMGEVWVSRRGMTPVLATRLDPARARILHDQPPGSDLQKGFIVVHDGERIGTLEHAGEPLPVFPVLDVVRSDADRVGKFEQMI
jgi:tetratricopeptide (TPR) repeat protein